MKKNFVFIVLGLLGVVFFNACEPKSDLDLDKKLNFSPLTVEGQKQKIESNALEFVEHMEDLLETPALQAIVNFVEIFAGEEEEEYEYWVAPLRVIATDLRNGNPNVLVGLEKQMKIIQDDYDEDEGIVFGEYVYNFESEDFDLERELDNKVIFHLPASQAAMESKTNNGLISFEFAESKIAIPDADINYPASAKLVVKVDNQDVLSASFSGAYYDDGMPKDVKQTLTIGDFGWEAKISNNKKKASAEYAFKKAKTTLMKLAAESTGKFEFSDIENTIQNDGDPRDIVNSIAAQYQVMNLAIKGGIANVKKFADDMDATEDGSKGLTEKQIIERQVAVANQHIVGYGYFVDDNKKFADLDFYVNEYEYEGWPPGQIHVDYEVAARFKLSDGSKVTIEEYVESGFGELIDKIAEIMESFE